MPSTTSRPTSTTSATRSTRKSATLCSCEELQSVFLESEFFFFSLLISVSQVREHYSCMYMCIYVWLQEEQRAVCRGHHSSPRVASMPAAALHVLHAAALPADNAYQNANWGEEVRSGRRGVTGLNSEEYVGQMNPTRKLLAQPTVKTGSAKYLERFYISVCGAVKPQRYNFFFLIN